MRIDSGFSVTAVNALQGARARQGGEADQGPGAPVLSRHAADIQIALDALKTTSDVREEQVEELKTQLAQGTFVVDEQALAQKLLGTRH